MSEYVVIFERADDGGWGAYLPDLPGVVALGTTRDEVFRPYSGSGRRLCHGDGGARTAPSRPGRGDRNHPGGLTPALDALPLPAGAPCLVDEPEPRRVARVG